MTHLKDLVARPPVHVRVRNLSGRVVVAVASEAIELSGSAEVIWRAFAPDRTIADVAAIVAAKFDESADEVLPDILDCVRDLHSRGLLELHEPEGHPDA